MRFRDLRAQYLALKTEIDNSIQSVLDSSDFILGKPVAELEGLLADYVGRRYCVSCSNGTDALQLSLMALDIKRVMLYLPQTLRILHRHVLPLYLVLPLCL